MEIETHPVQRSHKPPGVQARVPTAVTLRAYEVYRHLYSEQKALIEGNCRGGFGVNELVAFLYAGNFQREEWRRRVDEALTGMVGL